MLLKTPVGILSYGAYVPEFRITAEEILVGQQKLADNSDPTNPGLALGVKTKSIPDIDEDTATLATMAAAQAIERATTITKSAREHIHALFVGSESHPYAVKPTGTILHAALNLPTEMAMADLQFACKAGTQALQICASYVASGFVKSGLAIGADTAQSKPGDVLEFTAGAGAAAFLIGNDKPIAKIVATTSVASDTPDFWRRPGQNYPEHAGRFSGEPGYFHHVALATKNLLKETKLSPADLDFCVFHTPNAKFPTTVAKQLGFTPTQIQHSLIVKEIGNTYAAASLLALASVLDNAPAHAKILVTSYGSGSGADSFLIETTDELIKQRKHWTNLLAHQLKHTTPLTYQAYRQHTQHTH